MGINNLTRVIRIGFLASLFTFLLLTVGSGTPANAWDGVGGGGSGGGSCSGLTAGWRLFGNKNMAKPAQKPTPTTAAWDSFVNAANGDSACNGYGWTSLPTDLKEGCKRSTFIWAMMMGNGSPNGFVSNGQSVKNASSSVVNGYIDGFGSGSSYYNGARNRIKSLSSAHYAGGGMVIGCSYAWDDLPSTTWGTKCSDLAMWDTKVHRGGAQANSSYSTASQARLNCLLRCPTVNTNAAATDYHKWVRSTRARSSANAEDGWVPQVNGSNQAMAGDTPTDLSRRGAWCFSRPGETRGITRTKVTESDVPGQTYPYLWTTTLSDGTGAPHPGPTKFQGQPFTEVKTPYGDLLDDAANTDKGPTPTQINAAGQSTASTKHARATLTDNNKRWLAEGAVLNVTERTYYAFLSHYSRTEQPQRCTESRAWAFTYSRYEAVTMNVGAWAGCSSTSNGWINEGTFTLTEDYYLQAQTPEVTAFFQAVGNHCNANGYSSARTSTNGRGTVIDQVSNGDGSKNWSGSLLSELITGAGGGDSPANHALWGLAAASPKGTDAAGFYDKECAYDGVRADNTTSQPTMQTNFRDNERHAFAVDLFTPKAEGVVQGDAGQAVSTTVTRWLDGTPQVSQIENRGAFSMWSQPGASMFSQGKEVASSPTATQQAPPLQKNWDTTPFQARNLSISTGQSNIFQVAANWSSDKARPQVFTVKWEYAPTVDNTLPTTVGFDAGGARYYALTVEGVRIQGKVNGKFGATSSPAEFALQAANTGSGTSNKADLPLSYGSDLDANKQWKQDPHTYSPFYTGVRFIRATGE